MEHDSFASSIRLTGYASLCKIEVDKKREKGLHYLKVGSMP
jgi:hypothetical protein